MRLRLARNRSFVYATAAVLAAVGVFWPTPYSLMLPGTAVDLRHVISVSGYPAPRAPLYLTDVRFATHVVPLQLLAALRPGVDVFRTGDVVPGGMTAVEYDGVQREAMSESQSVAAFVAERAAGLRVPVPRTQLLAVYFAPSTAASRVLRPLDTIVAVNGRPVASPADLQRALSREAAGGTVRVAIVRHGRERVLSVPTMRYHGRTALGVYLTTIYDRPHIPVAVTYHLNDVAGSSAGLMFALEIYRTLRPSGIPALVDAAGTGTIGYDGTVGPIEGARQKIAAARAAGAKLFLVPKQNYAEVAGTKGMRVIAVSTLDDAVRALGR